MKSSVQTFRARSSHEALAEVKKALGPDAVILGTRFVQPPGLRALVTTPWVEITAGPPGAAGPAPRLRATPPPKSDRPAAPPARDPAAPALPQHLYPYYVQLVQNEVAEDLAARLVRAASEQLPPGRTPPAEELRAAVRACIAGLLPAAPPVAAPGPRRMAVVGPAGAGKTTTLAKLAARHALQDGRRVALLSLDAQRLGGAEALARFAEIIGVPFAAAQTIGEVKQALKRLADAELLLVDTPGVGLRETARFARLATLLRAARPDETHLVLPASLAPNVLTHMAHGFASLTPASLMLTRLDDAVGFGIILNAIDRLKLRLSYLTTGQNVPEDIEEACGARVAQLVLPA